MRLSKNPPSPIGKINFSAPGVGIISTALGGSYKELSGDSLAAAYVTGCIALMLEHPNKYGVSTDKSNLISSVYESLKKISINLGDHNLYGEGFIQFRKGEVY